MRPTLPYETYRRYGYGMSEGTHELPITDARDRLADVVNAAAYGGQSTYLTRRGRRVAVIMPAEAAEAAERWEDAQLNRLADEAVEEMEQSGEAPVSLEQARREFGL